MTNVGISWTDPYLTETSSDEARDGIAQKQEDLERVTREIEFSGPTTETTIALKEALTKKQRNRRPKDPSSCGAYQRASGRWSSEIKVGSSRIWLGTFDTMEEARRAYLSKKIEMEATTLSSSSGGDGCRAIESTGDPVVKESANKIGKSSHQAWLEDPIEKSEICGDGGGGSGDWVVAEGSSKGKRKSQRPYPGVFQRWGRWNAEVYDPIKKSKKWLGGYGSPEEAWAAIVAKKLEFDAIKKGQAVASSPCSVQASGSGEQDSVGGGDWAVQGYGSSDSSGGESWEVAVLKRFTESGGMDLNSVMQIASHIIDSNGNFIGEFSSLDDDLQIH